MNRPVRGVRLLAVAPELADGLEPADAAEAEQALVVPVLELDHRDEHLLSPDDATADGLMGLLMVRGLLLRELRMAGASSAELVGPGDLILPGDHGAGDEAAAHGTLTWRLLAPTRLAVLDGRFLARVQPWPQILAHLTRRALGRGHELARMAAICHRTRIEDRVLHLLWHFAERWGRVSSDGVHLDLPLTHEALAKLVGAHRPSVTTAIGGLEARGLLLRPDHGRWLLPHGAAQALQFRRLAS